MEITKSKFIASMAGDCAFPGHVLPQIAMAGKSNVGKSSLINALARNGKLARVSSDPGKTRLINFYQMNEAFYLVDLPGYGFARAPKHEQAAWAEMIEGYLQNSKQLAHVLLLVDLRHEPTENDRTMASWLRSIGVPFTVIGTKADKLSGAQRNRSIPAICRGLVVQPWEVIPFSSQTGFGREKLLAHLETLLDRANGSSAETTD